jgi:hypothetical protein
MKVVELRTQSIQILQLQINLQGQTQQEMKCFQLVTFSLFLQVTRKDLLQVIEKIKWRPLQKIFQKEMKKRRKRDNIQMNLPMGAIFHLSLKMHLNNLLLQDNKHLEQIFLSTRLTQLDHQVKDNN